jgi:hypothetical protein
MTDGKISGGKAAAIAMLVLGCIMFFGAPPIAMRDWGWRPTHVWLLDVVAGVAILVAIGRIAGQPLLTDERRRWSLSRLQLLSWTMLVLPTVWTMVVRKLLAGADDPLALGMDENLWALLGVSAASFVGSPLILERKRATTGLLDVRSVATHGDNTGEVRDLFRGEESGNAEVVDIGRVQMCLFTAIAVAVYFAAVWNALAVETATALAFPPMSQSLVGLIGISHATYLAAKLPDRAARTAVV